MERATDSTAGTASAEGRPVGDRPRRSRRRLVVLVLLALVVALVVVTAWIGLRAFEAATSLRSVADDVRQVEADVRAGRTGGLPAAADRIQRDAARAERATSGPAWWIAERLPLVGVDAAAVRTVAAGVDRLASGALTPLAEVADSLDPSSLRPVDGRVDLAPLVAAAPALQSASAVAERVGRDVGALDPGALHGPLVGPVVELQRGLSTATSVLDTASRLASALPPMLGADGPRQYLTLFLNSGELRTQGGIVGAMALVTADDGRLTLTDQASTRDLPRWSEPVLPLSDPELAIGTDQLGRYIQNTVMLPETPRVGELAAEMWRQATGQSVDGVVLVDPVALAYVLDATGDVRHPDGDVLTPDTLVQTLLLDAYAEQSDPQESDAFFAAAASATFEALAAGAGDPADLIDALMRATDERRLSVWSTHPEEQGLITGSAIDGALLTGGHDGAVGVFLDNTSGWKTDTFLRSDVSVENARCDGGELTMDVALTLTSTLPADADDLPYYVVGDGSTGSRSAPSGCASRSTHRSTAPSRRSAAGRTSSAHRGRRSPAATSRSSPRR
ncbi:DUF4012 domain-containing protein [Cellulomonas sp. ATA003]|uniref:DUF4012 domain-containing protein n=1 Tax=Cellulomonas sp. ATA003 TaxID=3073064 RepID=UPI002873B58B|nr:DUF4012 domain-containing protein [Cellulomonas sp. ATA003]WNB85174.1 DUF4012 domain-containing protein [Cellulomonas sp. ATA003]